MILVDNINFLKKRFPNVWNYYKAVEDQVDVTQYEVTPSKSGVPYVKVTMDNKETYIHSKYNPIEEAERWVNKYEDDMEQYDHVLFYGVGLGYQIDVLMNRCPDKGYSIYEPDFNMFYQLLCHKRLDQFPTKNLKNLYVEYAEALGAVAIMEMTELLLKNVLIIVHPVYERLFEQKTKLFLQNFKDFLISKKNGQATSKAYERLWTVNSLYNFTKVLETQNVIREKKHLFEGKPIIMVAAGPSLEDEIENLRHIKQEGLAYIFSVGSANKALIKNGIYPDAVTSYDPNTYNHLVFEEIITQNLPIPLIFGTSMGYKTVQLYPGPMLYMITNQDTVAPYYLNTDPDEIVKDAPTIAAITLQLIAKLGCENIILVGQNFGYRNDQYYAKGIEYAYRQSEQLSEIEKQDLIWTEGVNGDQIRTSYSHNLGRTQMEGFLAEIPNVKVFNTTKGGARIKGTEYRTLDEIIEQSLDVRVVDPNWYEGTKTKYNREFLLQQANQMKAEYESFSDLFNRMLSILRKMDALSKFNEVKQLEKMFPKMDNAFKRLTRNVFFDTYIRPISRTEHEVLIKHAQIIRETGFMQDKVKLTLQGFGQYLESIQKAFADMEDLFLKIQQVIYFTIDELEEEQN
jgi:hypothetical protein